MESSRYRRSRVIYAAVGLGMAMGSVAFTSEWTGISQGGPGGEITCAAFLRHGVDKDNTVDDAQKHDVKLYRTKSYYDHISKFPKWVGGVELKGHESEAFPHLARRAKGCIYFQPDSVGTEPPNAKLWSETSANPIHTYKGIALCTVTEHEDDVEPEWIEEPDNCDSITVKFQTTMGMFVRTWTGAQGLKGAAVIETEMQKGLEDMKVPDAEIKKILRARAKAGPWYPCAETGCCRAYEEEE